MAYRVTPKIREQAAKAREAIVRAAIEQLAEGGYASTSMHAVAKRAGVATGTVYRHFPGKSELFAEVFRRASQREVDVLKRVAGDSSVPATERIAASVETFARRALAEPKRAWALIAEPVDPAVEAERLVFRRAYREGFARILQDGVRSGELAAQDVEVVAAALVGALAEALVGPLSAADTRGHEALVASLVSFSLSAISVRSPDARQHANA